MTSHESNSIEQLVNETLSVIEKVAELPHGADPVLEDLKATCKEIPERVRSGHLKVAVVGVIKSGKSTLVNALVKKELVRRGAGVLTAITTRIRKGRKNQAVIYLKSWDEINRTLESVLDMFPGEPPQTPFDIRRKKDREYLAGVFHSLESEFPVTADGLRPEALTIRHALEGYEHCSRFIQADEEQLVFQGREFERHKIYTADPAKAFYIKDACLELFGKYLDADIELADCQGADSTDPAQLSQILAYIRNANLILYCVSSRTGLRASDVNFLKTIQRLGLMENVLFINNCDLSEHEDLADLQTIETHLTKELGYLHKTPPRIFSFSALFYLFDTMKNLSKREGERLALWQADKAMAEYSMKNCREFMSVFEELLAKERYRLIYANPLAQIRLVTGGLSERCQMISRALESDIDGQGDARDRILDVEENVRRLKVIVAHSVQGAVQGLTQEIRDNLKLTFFSGKANVSQKIKNFIRAQDMDVSPYKAGVKETGFKQILYLMFQDFKRRLDLFIIEEIDPEITRAVNTLEKRIEDYFKSLLDSYQIDVPAMGEEVRKVSLELFHRESGNDGAVDLAAIKKIIGITQPKQVFSLSYTSRIRANALTDFGVHSLVLFAAALFDRKVSFSFTPGFGRAAQKIKKEAMTALQIQIRAYYASLEQDYFIPLIDAATRDFREKILERFARYESLSQDMDQIFNLRQEEKEAQAEKILSIQNTLAAITEQISGFRLKEACGQE